MKHPIQLTLLDQAGIKGVGFQMRTRFVGFIGALHMSGAARAAPLLASFMMFFYLLYDVSAWLRQAPVTGRTGRRSQFGGMPTAEGLLTSQKRATLTVKVSHESRVMRRCVA